MPAIDSPAVEVTYIGGPTALLRIAGMSFITDPTFDPAGTQYASGPVTLRKSSGPALAVEQLGRIDVALVSHAQHADNLDHKGRELLESIPLVLTTKASAAQLNGAAVGLAPGDARVVTTSEGVRLRITATPARHGPAGIEKAVGEVVGFVVTLVESGEDLVYVTGDTVWYEATAAVAREFEPRVVLPFAGGAMTSRGPVFLTMNTNDVLALAAAFEGAQIVPLHHEGWEHFTQSQHELAQAFEMMGLSSRLHRVEAGQTYRFTQ